MAPIKGYVSLFDRRKLNSWKDRDLSAYMNRGGEKIKWEDIKQNLTPGHYILTHRFISYPQCLTGTRTRRVSQLFGARNLNSPIFLLEDNYTKNYLDGKNKIPLLFVFIDNNNKISSY